jgi:hypothetical protein
MSDYVKKQALLDHINAIRNAHIEKRNDGDECDQFANEAVADWLWAIQEQIQSGAFDMPLIGVEEYYRLRAALEYIRSFPFAEQNDDIRCILRTVDETLSTPTGAQKGADQA